MMANRRFRPQTLKGTLPSVSCTERVGESGPCSGKVRSEGCRLRIKRWWITTVYTRNKRGSSNSTYARGHIIVALVLACEEEALPHQDQGSFRPHLTHVQRQSACCRASRRRPEWNDAGGRGVGEKKKIVSYGTQGKREGDGRRRKSAGKKT